MIQVFRQGWLMCMATEADSSGSRLDGYPYFHLPFKMASPLSLILLPIILLSSAPSPSSFQKHGVGGTELCGSSRRGGTAFAHCLRHQEVLGSRFFARKTDNTHKYSLMYKANQLRFIWKPSLPSLLPVQGLIPPLFPDNSTYLLKQ